MSSTTSSDAPALSPPPGVTPNFVNPYTQSPAFAVTAVLCLSFATASMVVRLTTSLRGSSKRLRLEDFTCVISWLGLIATCVLTALEIRKGLGRHQWDVPESDLIPLAKLLYINRVWYSPTILAAKLTVLLQLMRIFVPTKRGLVHWLIQILIWLNVCFYSANVLSVIFQCNPVYKAWDSSAPGSCVDTNLNLVVTGSINVISDILILLLPLWTIWHLRMPIRAKVNVSIAFGAGIFANFAGIMRLVYSVRIIQSMDLTYLRFQHGMWTIAEITTAIICASLPLVPQFVGLFRTQRPTARSTFVSSGSKSHGRSESTGSLRGGDSVELGFRPGQTLQEAVGWSDAGKTSVGAFDKEKQVTVTGMYVPTDEESGTALYEGAESEEGIRKTVRIEQTS